jgi:uncharacterized membrane protein
VDGDRRPPRDAGDDGGVRDAAGLLARHTAVRRLAFSALGGAAAALVSCWFVAWQATVLIAWEVAAGGFLLRVWRDVLPQDATATARHASVEDGSRLVADLTLVGASLASLVAVVLILLKAAQVHGPRKALLTGIGILGVAISWAVVHTVFTLTYGHMYYGGEEGGIEFPGGDPPSYRDFAYLAFTIGMCYQVSDTDIRSRRIRATALRHSLLAYVLGTAVIALTINAVAGLV